MHTKPRTSARTRSVWLPISLTAIFLVACGTEAVGSEAAKEEIVSMQVVGHPVIHDSLKELIDKSDAVVIGTFSGATAEKIIPHRDTNDPEQIDSERSGFGTVYDFDVERYLMGEGPGKLGFYQYEGIMTPGPSGETVALEDPTAFPPPEASQRYLLLISYSEYTPEIVTGPARPFRFFLVDGVARPDSSNGSILENFPAEAEAGFIDRVEAAIRAR